MRTMDQIPIVQFGASGPVAEIFRETVAHPNSLFRLEAIVPASGEDLVGLSWGNTEFCNQPALANAPVISVHDGIHNTEAHVVFSSVREDAASLYEDEFAKGRLLATNASPNRMRPDVALMNAYFNPEQLEELYAIDSEGKIIANGNCMSIIGSLAMSPIEKQLGIIAADIESLQGWSGAGKDSVPLGKEGIIEEIGGDEAEKLRTEPNKFLGSIATSAGVVITAKPRRAPWVRGHQSKIIMRLAKPTTIDEVESILDDVREPDELRGVRYGPNSPQRKPITVVRNSLTVPSSSKFTKLRRDVKPMKIRARVISVSGDNNDILTIEVAGDNLILGAAGSSVMNLAYAAQRGLIS